MVVAVTQLGQNGTLPIESPPIPHAGDGIASALYGDMKNDLGKSQELTDVVHRNIRSLLEVRHAHESERTGEQRIADWITHFIGRMHFVYFNLLFLGGWLWLNLRPFGLIPFDPFPFSGLQSIATLEAIFLATFVLIAQNRLNQLTEKRADLDVQISLLTEHELTQLIRLTDSIARHVGVASRHTDSVEQLKRDVPPQEILDQIEQEKLNFSRKD